MTDAEARGPGYHLLCNNRMLPKCWRRTCRDAQFVWTAIENACGIERLFAWTGECACADRTWQNMFDRKARTKSLHLASLHLARPVSAHNVASAMSMNNVVGMQQEKFGARSEEEPADSRDVPGSLVGQEGASFKTTPRTTLDPKAAT